MYLSADDIHLPPDELFAVIEHLRTAVDQMHSTGQMLGDGLWTMDRATELMDCYHGITEASTILAEFIACIELLQPAQGNLFTAAGYVAGFLETGKPLNQCVSNSVGSELRDAWAATTEVLGWCESMLRV